MDDDNEISALVLEETNFNLAVLQNIAVLNTMLVFETTTNKNSVHN